MEAKIKKINTFEEFEELFSEIEDSKCKVFINGNRINKRKLHLSDVEDMFDSGIKFLYYFLNCACYLTTTNI